ncbi:hypothetical protein [Streptomyces alfalfae]
MGESARWWSAARAAGWPGGPYSVDEVTVIEVKPSAGGAGLVDLTVTQWCENAPPGAERTWELVRIGHLKSP